MNTTFSQTIDLFLNVRGQQSPAQFFAGHTSTNNVGTVQFVQGDQALLRLWLVSPPAQVGQPNILHRANGPIAFAVKDKVGGNTLLAFASNFTLVDSSPAQDGSGEHYEAPLNLNTTELLAAITGNAATTTARLDIELQSPGNAQRLTFARDITLVRQTYQGTETQPVPVTPPYPAPGDIPSKNEVDSLITTKVTQQVAAQITPIVEQHIPQAVADAVADEIQDKLNNLGLLPGDPVDYTITALSLGEAWNTITGALTAALAEASVSLDFLPRGTLFEVPGKPGRYAYQGTVTGQSTFISVKTVTADAPPVVGDTLRVVAVAGAAGADGDDGAPDGALRYDVSQSLDSDQRTRAFSNLGLIIDSARIAIGNAAGVSTSNAVAIGNYSAATDSRATAIGDNAKATSYDTFAGGYLAYASGSYSIAIGSGAQAIAQDAIAIGHGSYAYSYGSIAIGYNAYTTDYCATVVGGSAAADGYCTAFGYYATARDYYSLAVGYDAYSRSYGVAVGSSNSAEDYAIAIGYCVNSSYYGVGIGYGAYAGDNTVAIGQSSTAYGSQSVALGYSAYAGGSYSLALGYDAEASYEGAIAIGGGSYGTGYYSIAIGYGAYASDYGIAAGSYSQAYSGGVAIGYNAYVGSESSIAIGRDSQAYDSYTFSVGSSTIRRRIVNVDDGFYSYDAVTIGQIQNLVSAINSATGYSLSFP